MFCKNCGKDIKDSKFCPYCGEKGVDETNEVNAEEKNQENTVPLERESNHAKSKKGIIAGGAIALVIVVIVGTVFLTKNRNISDEKEVEVSEAIEETTQSVQEPEEEETDVADEESEVVEEEETDVEEEETNEDKTESQVLETPRIREIKRVEDIWSYVWKFDSDGDITYSEFTHKADGFPSGISHTYYTYLLDGNGNKAYGLIPEGVSYVGQRGEALISTVIEEYFLNGEMADSSQNEYFYDDQNRLVSAKSSQIDYEVQGRVPYRSMTDVNCTYDNNIASCYEKEEWNGGDGDQSSERTWKEKYDSENRIIERFDRVESDSSGKVEEQEDIEYKYDDAGRLISNGYKNWEYDEEGRLLHDEGIAILGSIDYEYDESGRVLKSYSSGYWTKYYNYDEKNLCVSINLIADSPASNPERVINAKNEGYDPETEFIFTYDDKNRLIKAQVCDLLDREESGPLWSEPYEITIDYDENNLPICIRSDKEGVILRYAYETGISDILRQQYSEETQKVLFYDDCVLGVANFSYVTD